MSSLRIEFILVGSGRGRLGGQVDVREAEPLASYTLTVGTSPTSLAGQPLVPSETGTIFAEIGGADAPTYVDIGASPDPTAEPRLLVLPGSVQRLRVRAGQRVSAVLAGDLAFGAPATRRANAAYVETIVALGAGAWAQLAAAKPDRQKLILADPAGIGCLWSRADAAPANDYQGGVPFSLAGTPGTFVFDDPVPRGAIYGRAASAGSVTVVEA